MNKPLICLLSCYILLGCSVKSGPASRVAVLPYYKDATFTPQWYKSEQEVPSNFHKIPSFSLINQLGETITEEDVKGKVYVVNFFFTTCPGICSKMNQNLAIVQDEFVNHNFGFKWQIYLKNVNQ